MNGFLVAAVDVASKCHLQVTVDTQATLVLVQAMLIVLGLAVSINHSNFSVRFNSSGVAAKSISWIKRVNRRPIN